MSLETAENMCKFVVMVNFGVLIAEHLLIFLRNIIIKENLLERAFLNSNHIVVAVGVVAELIESASLVVTVQIHRS